MARAGMVIFSDQKAMIFFGGVEGGVKRGQSLPETMVSLRPLPFNRGVCAGFCFFNNEESVRLSQNLDSPNL